ncbi:hypothetical protein [Streptomyces sp. NPDC021096]|uniref:hypothetical protein n=1 Tax=Streptomyces sp. NPDC021096 TaxID=3154792 RepID=UPI003402D1A5
MTSGVRPRERVKAQQNRLTRVTLNLNPRAVQAIAQAHKISGDSRTEIINRAVQMYAEIEIIRHEGGKLYVRPAGDADRFEQLRFW